MQLNVLLTGDVDDDTDRGMLDLLRTEPRLIRYIPEDPVSFIQYSVLCV